MNTIIVSDLHIGSRYFMFREFEYFLRNICENHELILNGDVIDDPHKKLKPHHQGILDIIEQISHRQRVVWVLGNHDNGFIPKRFGSVQFRRIYALQKKLLIAHGHDFDEIMPRNQTFLKALLLMHDLRVKLGARPVHVANYAKKWGRLYKILCKNVMMNAVQCAIENDYEAVTCGHTHYPDDCFSNGVRYVNTGSWTESPPCYLLVTEEEITLKSIEG
jgi:UDP-2,3-diacylglucosamine pyrophosphatase LpxH